MEQTDWRDVVRKLGGTLDETQHQLLVRFRDWLATEAIPAGVLGPHELGRLDSRHIADSLLFSRLLPGSADQVLDLGSGVGLPGIPLAILKPNIQFRLIDRSQRRVDLAKRAVRVLRLSNVEVVKSEIATLDDQVDFVVSRATLPPNRAFRLVERLLSPIGVGVLGGSWVEQPDYPGWESVDLGSEVLDQPVWFLIMRRR